jgi:putative Mg2+ transporter-C (MgtC) family protein
LISTQEMLFRLAAATVLGGLIGAERERVESTVGLRTHAIVALGSATFRLVSMFGFANAGGPPGVVLDPSRVAAQIVTGIGFLGAGVIIFRKEVVRGLTTAASIWLVAAIGMAIGGGLYLAAAGAAVFGPRHPVGDEAVGAAAGRRVPPGSCSSSSLTGAGRR